MVKQTVRLALGLAVWAVMIGSLSGCGQRPIAVSTEKHTEKQTEKETQTEEITERVTETEKETESETQKLITSVDYTSKDGSVKITLPDNTWKVTQDADEMRVFQSGSAAIINIVHASTPTALSNLSVMRSEEALKASLTSQYASEDAYQVTEFGSAQVKGVDIYRYTVKYNATARMWAYSVTNAIVASDQAYVVTGSVTDDNKNLLEAVRKSVESFRVLKDETLKDVTGEVLSGITQKTSETVNPNTQSDQELKSLTDYGASVTLVTTDTVNVRQQPGTDSGVITTLSGNTKVTVVGETQNWFKVNVMGNIGYIRKDFLVYENAAKQSETTQMSAAPGDESAAETGTATNYGAATTLYASGDVNIRSAPGTDSSVIGSLPAGTAVSVIGETDNWFIVSINGSTAYVSKSYLTADSSAASGTTAEQATGGNTAPSGYGPSYVSGTVVGTTVDTITVQGDDGKTYTIYYGDADTATQDGLYSGVYVEVACDSGQAASDGTLYATNVVGY